MFSCGADCRTDGWLHGYCTGIVRTRLWNIGMCWSGVSVQLSVCLSVCLSVRPSVCLSTLDSGANKISKLQQELQERTVCSMQGVSTNRQRAVLPLILSRISFICVKVTKAIDRLHTTTVTGDLQFKTRSQVWSAGG